MNLMEIQLDDHANKDKSDQKEAKALNNIIAQLNQQLSKQKASNSELQSKIKNSETQMREQNREIDQVERQNRKQNMDVSNKDAKLNRVLEENEKLKQ